MANNSKFVIELHVGKEYAVGRMNCDSTGRNKDILFNGKRYHRISSQSKKYAWRKDMAEYFKERKHVYKTRSICDVFESELLKKDNEFYKNHAHELAKLIVTNILGCKFDDDDADVPSTAQVLVVTDYDVKDVLDVFCEKVATEDDIKKLSSEKEKKKDDNNKTKSKTATKKGSLSGDIQKEILKRLPLRQHGVECSLFGRMSTSGVMETVESSICVNHSYSLGKASGDDDYFIVSENYMAKNGREVVAANTNSGAGYLDSKDIAAGHVYYEYASVDVTHFYNNLCKGLDMEKPENKERVKGVLKETIMFLVDEILTAAPKGAQNSFATSPLPVGALIRIRDLGQNLTADNFCFEELNKYCNEKDKFINAMNNFVKYSKSNYRHYMKDIFVAFSDEKKADCGECMNLSDAIDTIGEMIDERF